MPTPTGYGWIDNTPVPGSSTLANHMEDTYVVNGKTYNKYGNLVGWSPNDKDYQKFGGDYYANFLVNAGYGPADFSRFQAQAENEAQRVKDMMGTADLYSKEKAALDAYNQRMDWYKGMAAATLAMHKLQTEYAPQVARDAGIEGIPKSQKKSGKVGEGADADALLGTVNLPGEQQPVKPPVDIAPVSGKGDVPNIPTTPTTDAASPYAWITNGYNEPTLDKKLPETPSIPVVNIDLPNPTAGLDTDVELKKGPEIETPDVEEATKASDITLPTVDPTIAPINVDSDEVRKKLEAKANITPKTADTHFELGPSGKPRYELYHGDDANAARNNAMDIVEDAWDRDLINEEEAERMFDRIDELGETTDYSSVMGPLLNLGDRTVTKEDTMTEGTFLPPTLIADDGAWSTKRGQSTFTQQLTDSNGNPAGEQSVLLRKDDTVIISANFADEGKESKYMLTVDPEGNLRISIQRPGEPGSGKKTELHTDVTVTKMPDGVYGIMDKGKAYNVTNEVKSMLAIAGMALDDPKAQDYFSEEAEASLGKVLGRSSDSGIDDASPAPELPNPSIDGVEGLDMPGVKATAIETPKPAKAEESTGKKGVYDRTASIADKVKLWQEHDTISGADEDTIAKDIADEMVQGELPDEWGNLSNPRVNSNTYEVPWTEWEGSQYVLEAYKQAIENRDAAGAAGDEKTEHLWNTVSKYIMDQAHRNNVSDLIPELAKIEAGTSDKFTEENLKDAVLGPGRAEETDADGNPAFNWEDVAFVDSGAGSTTGLDWSAMEKYFDDIKPSNKEMAFMILNILLRGGTGLDIEGWNENMQTMMGKFDKDAANTEAGKKFKERWEEFVNALGGIWDDANGLDPRAIGETIKEAWGYMKDAKRITMEDTAAGKIANSVKEITKATLNPIIMAMAVALGIPMVAAGMMLKNATGEDSLVGMLMKYGSLEETDARAFAAQLQEFNFDDLDIGVPGTAARNSDAIARYDPTSREKNHAGYNKGLKADEEAKEQLSDENVKAFISRIIRKEPILLKVVKGL